MTFKYFSRDEFACKATGENEIEDELIFALDELREHCGFPFVITSGYRSPDHPIELRKKNSRYTCTRYSCGHSCVLWSTKVHYSKECY